MIASVQSVGAGSSSRSYVAICACVVGLAGFILGMSFFPQGAAAKPWWPVIQPGAGGDYCRGTGASQVKTGRGYSDGSIEVEVRGEGLRVRLDIKRAAYSPGDLAYARVENVGTELVFDGRDYGVERRVRGEWIWVGPAGLKWPRIPLGMLSSGRARCMNFRIPKHGRVGRYRIVKSVDQYGPNYEEPLHVELAREFSVITSQRSPDVRRRPLTPAHLGEGGGSYCGQNPKPQNHGNDEAIKGPRRSPVAVPVLGEGLLPRLGSKQSVYRRGSVFYGRLENIGTVPFTASYGHTIARLEGDEWQYVVPPLRRGPRPGLPVLKPGSGLCMEYRIPMHAPIGRYKATKRIFFWTGPDEKSSFKVSREFEVRP